jgi:hypothetical protein
MKHHLVGQPLAIEYGTDGVPERDRADCVGTPIATAYQEHIPGSGCRQEAGR